jgi:hypothetical protein
VTPRQELEALIAVFEKDLRSAFLAAIADVVDNVVIGELIRQIEIGDVEGAFRTLGYSEAAMRPLTAAIERAFETGGVAVGRTFPHLINTTNGRAIFRFNVRNSRAEAYLRDKSSELVSRIGEDTRVNLRNTLTVGMERGLNPRNVALDIVGRIGPGGHRVGGIVGLTTQQEAWVRNIRIKLEQLDPVYFERELRDKRFDGTVRKAIESGKPLDRETVDKLVLRYKDNALKYRGETIGRTEALQSLNAAEYEAAMQAVDLGATKTSAVKKEWDSAGDKRVRFSHRMLNGQRVALDEPFVSPSGARMRYPGDTSLGAPGGEVINCRCRFKTVVDWFAGI